MDGGTPPRSASAVVDITVTRNLRDPQFNPDTIRVSIPDNSPPGMAITTVSATDNDRSVCIVHNVLKLKVSIQLKPCLRITSAFASTTKLKFNIALINGDASADAENGF